MAEDSNAGFIAHKYEILGAYYKFHLSGSQNRENTQLKIEY